MAPIGMRLLGSLLFGVEPTYQLIFAGMIAVLMGVAFISGLIPVIRASRADSAGTLWSAA